MNYKKLTRQEMINVIEGKGHASRIPMTYHFWTSPSVFGTNKDEAQEYLKKYPMDVQNIYIAMPGVFEGSKQFPDFRWVKTTDSFESKSTALDERVAIKDYDNIDEIIRDFPKQDINCVLPDIQEPDGRYRLGNWWFLLFERHWELRGMVNALTDYYEEPENVHKLFRALTDYYLETIELAHKNLKLDGIIVSDDLGTQTGPFFSPAIFKEFFKPYYKEIVKKIHSLNMHFWLHTCGNIEDLITDFIDIGIDVLHPIQKYTMDERKIAEKYGDKICIWAGFDVQRTIPYGSEEDVRKEVRFMIDTYYRPEGRLILTAGNGITADCKIESLFGLLDESYNYGKMKVSEEIK